MAPSERRKRELYNAQGLPPSLGVTGAWITQMKMAVNGCIFESECLYLCSVVCMWHAASELCVFENGRLCFFLQGERSKWVGWLDV